MKLESKVFSERLHGRWARDKYTERKKQLNKTFKEKKIHPFLDGYHYCHSNLNVVSPLHVMPGSRFWGSESYQKWGNTNVKYRLNNHNIADQHKPGNPDKTNTFYCIGGKGGAADTEIQILPFFSQCEYMRRKFLIWIKLKFQGLNIKN